MGAAKGLHMDDWLPLREVGIRNLVGTHQRGLGVQLGWATVDGLGGATAVTFADLGLSDMADTSYAVFVGTADAADLTWRLPDPATLAVSGFTIPAGANTAAGSIPVIIVGQIEGHPDP